MENHLPPQVERRHEERHHGKHQPQMRPLRMVATYLVATYSNVEHVEVNKRRK